MKLIIDIPEVDYECAKQRWMSGNDAHKTDYYISKGIPLDDVKAEIEKKCDRINSIASVLSYPQHREIQELLCEILESIGKESEGT